MFFQEAKSPENTKLCDAYGAMAMWFNKAHLLPKALGSADKLTPEERRECFLLGELSGLTLAVPGWHGDITKVTTLIDVLWL